MLHCKQRFRLPPASPTGFATIAGLVLLSFTVESAFSQQAPIQGKPGWNIRASTSMDPRSAMLNSRPIIEIRVGARDYELKCEQRPASSDCFVVPNVRFDKTDLDALSKRGRSFRLGLCDSSSEPCRRGEQWDPRLPETNLRKNGLSAPGTFYLSWQVDGYPGAAVSNPLSFYSGPSPSTRK